MAKHGYTKQELVWVSSFLGATAAVVSLELIAALGNHPHRHSWTSLAVRHVPMPVAMGLAITLSGWLPSHLLKYYRMHRDTIS